MVRKQAADNPRLEALLDERDNLKIQYSLALDANPSPDEERLAALRKAISEVQRRIHAHYPG